MLVSPSPHLYPPPPPLLVTGQSTCKQKRYIRFQHPPPNICHPPLACIELNSIFFNVDVLNLELQLTSECTLISTVM